LKEMFPHYLSLAKKKEETHSSLLNATHSKMHLTK
jgi:hypothetical protein